MVWIMLLFALMVNVAAADEVKLFNGDRITGEVVRMKDGRLSFKTDYAGEIHIEWSKVEMLQAEQPLPIVYKNGTKGEATTFVYPGQGLEPALTIEETTVAVDIAAVAAINAQPKPAVKIIARADAGISRESGNTDNESYNLLAELMARYAHHRLTVGGSLNRQWTDGTATAKNWRGFGKYDNFFRKQWFVYLNALFENNEFSDLNLRSTYGAGGGHQFFESERLNLSVSLGAACVAEDFIVAQDKEFAAFQWVNRYDQFFFDKSLQLFHDNNGYCSLENSAEWLINTRQGIRLPLYKGLRLTVQYNYDYNNRPSPDAKSKWDSMFLLLLGYESEN